LSNGGIDKSLATSSAKTIPNAAEVNGMTSAGNGRACCDTSFCASATPIIAHSSNKSLVNEL